MAAGSPTNRRYQGPRSRHSPTPSVGGAAPIVSVACGGNGGPLSLAPVSQRTVLILVRHGETPANLDGVWHGSTDSPLTARGEQQAARVATHVGAAYADAAAVYTSDLQRARRTAEAIGQALAREARLERGLREYDLGSWEGKTYGDLHDTHDLWHHMKTNPHFAPHGGESPNGVTERFTNALSSIAARHPGERVVVVAHGGAFSLAMGALLHGHYSHWHPVMENCAVSELVLEPRPALLSFNYTDHLAGV
jgi:broad specificity phosphatase PhoE